MAEYIDRETALNAFNGRIKLSDACLPFVKEYLQGVHDRIKAIPSADVVERKEVKTNADRIRAMSDEELAELVNSPCPPTTPCVEDAYGEPNCKNCWLEWLKEEVDG